MKVGIHVWLAGREGAIVHRESARIACINADGSIDVEGIDQTGHSFTAQGVVLDPPHTGPGRQIGTHIWAESMPPRLVAIACEHHDNGRHLHAGY